MRFLTPALAAAEWAKPGPPVQAYDAPMFTMAPSRSAGMSRRASSREHKKVPLSTMSTTVRQALGLISSAGTGKLPAALLTSTATGPRVDSTESKAAPMASASRMSQGAAIALPPACSTAATPAARCCSSRLKMPTDAPSRPNSVAMAFPRPVPPPVTTTTASAKVPDGSADVPRGGGRASPGGVTAAEPMPGARRRAVGQLTLRCGQPTGPGWHRPRSAPVGTGFRPSPLVAQVASSPVDFDLSPELSALQESTRRLAQDKIKPRARQIDSTGEYPQDIFDAFRDADMLGLCLPTELGGSDAGILGLTIAIEEVAKYSNTAALMLLLTRLPVGPVLIAGNEEQKKRYLPGIATGELRAGFGLSEPQAGSDVAGMRTRARPDTGTAGSQSSNGGWILSGTKCWMSGVREADWYTVFAKTGDPASRDHGGITAFIVERSWKGVSVPRTDHKMGVKGIDTGELVLDDVHVPAENVIGEVGGFRLAMLGLNAMRPIVAARGIGLAEGALMYATEYVKGREAFGGTISDFQGISGRSPRWRSTSRRPGC